MLEFLLYWTRNEICHYILGMGRTIFSIFIIGSVFTAVPEFLLYSTRNEIFRYILGVGRTEILYTREDTQVEEHNIFAVDFDYRDNCVYFADGFDHTINVSLIAVDGFDLGISVKL